jgi:crotonobetainyl-CoA:carnitine CoA-transferase CaiB-like acyl-CoA transferase
LPPVRLGEHNEYVYKQLLKVSDDEYMELEQEGHIGMDYAPEVS